MKPDTQKPAGGRRASERLHNDDDTAKIGGHRPAVNSMVERRREALLADLRSASAHAKAWQAEIDRIGVNLKVGALTTQQAIDLMREMGIPVTFDVLPGPGDTIGEAA